MKIKVKSKESALTNNSSLDEENGVIQLKNYYNIGIATHTSDGLMVNVIRDVDKQVDVRPAEFDPDVVDLSHMMRRSLAARVGLGHALHSPGDELAGERMIHVPQTGHVSVRIVVRRVRDDDVRTNLVEDVNQYVQLLK